MANHLPRQLAAALAAGAVLASTPALAVDADAAQSLAQQNKCLKCHADDIQDGGPSFSKVAAKYKNQGGDAAESRLYTHLTTGEKARFPDGHEEKHGIVKTSPRKDAAQIKNLIQWILAQ
jgi:cytochrome c